MSARRHLALLAALAASALSSPGFADENNQSFTAIERGRYLTTAGDCIACHTKPGGKPFAGGLAIETPFGNIVSPNITPDRETGIGRWSDEEFVRAMQQGIGRNGQHLYPAFPYPSFTKASRNDILAIKTYLGTIEPEVNAVVSNQLPFPFNVRASLIVWNALNFTPGELQPRADRSPEWNRGGYLVEGLGHCAACHTPKTLTGGDEKGEAYKGGVIQNWFAPALTNDDRTGLGRWSVPDVVEYLKTGHNRFAAASGPMAEVVGDSTSHLAEPDLAAIATYLKDIPGGSSAAPAIATGDQSFNAGKDMYRASCSACHGQDGAGIKGLFPALAGSGSVQSANATSMIRVVLQGVRSVATERAVTGPAMPPFDKRYSDQQIAQLLTYIRNDWGNRAAAVATGDVTTLRKTLATEGQ